MRPECYVETDRPEFDEFYQIIKSFLEQDVLHLNIDGKKISGYRSPDAKSIWIRDHSDMLRAAKYFNLDLTSAIEHFGETQAENGRIFDYFTCFPEKIPCERENWVKYVRVPVEADVEFRFVKAIYLAWQATGDDEWLLKLLPKMDKALDYVINHPWRWENKLGLVKRAYTIDTWDFAFTNNTHDWLQFQIDDNTYWGIMHGDNSGYYEAFRFMALFYQYFNNPEKSELWLNRAIDIKNALNNTCWNGSFYTHFVKLVPFNIPGVDESAQLSFSNPMNINRGVTSHEMAVSIIQEYLKRKESSNSFAEWFSIDPPFPNGIFGDDKLVKGAYVNGGIMPVVGGELAKAAFNNGFEKYGVDILTRYYKMIAEKSETYLWYFPDGTVSDIESSTSPDATPTDGWGSSAMLYGFIEGLIGIEDKFKKFKKVKLSPRWTAADVKKANIHLEYKVSNSSLNYDFQLTDNLVTLAVNTKDSDVQFHIMIPDRCYARQVDFNEHEVQFKNNSIRESHYVDFDAHVQDNAMIKIQLTRKA